MPANKRSVHALIALAFLFVCLAGLAAEAPGALPAGLEGMLELGRISADAGRIVALDADGTSWAALTLRDGAFRVISGSSAWGPYEAVGDLLVRKGGRTPAFSYRKGASWYVFAEGKERGPYQAVSMLDEDRGTISYCYQQADLWYAAAGETSTGPYTRLTPIEQSDRPDSQALWDLAAARRASTYPEYSDLPASSPARFADSSKGFAFSSNRWASRSLEMESSEYLGRLRPADALLAVAIAKDGLYILSGRERFGPFDNLGRILPLVDGSGIAFSAHDASGWILRAGGSHFGPFVFEPEWRFHPDGRQLVFTENTDGFDWLHVEGRRLGPFRNFIDWTWSPDGKRFAFMAAPDGDDAFSVYIEGKRRDFKGGSPELRLADSGSFLVRGSSLVSDQLPNLVIDGVEFGPCNEYLATPDLRHALRLEQRPAGLMVHMSGPDAKPWSAGPFSDATLLLLSDDGKEFAYAHSDGERYYVTDDTGSYEMRKPRWGLDELTVAAARSGPGWRIAIPEPPANGAETSVVLGSGIGFERYSGEVKAFRWPPDGGTPYALVEAPESWLIVRDRSVLFRSTLEPVALLPGPGKAWSALLGAGGERRLIIDGRETEIVGPLYTLAPQGDLAGPVFTRSRPGLDEIMTPSGPSLATPPVEGERLLAPAYGLLEYRYATESRIARYVIVDGRVYPGRLRHRGALATVQAHAIALREGLEGLVLSFEGGIYFKALGD